MELKLVRNRKTDLSTIGELFINNVFECFVLEDRDRGLTSITPRNQIKQLKVFSKTAIPYGRYEVIISFSNRFKKRLPLLLNVPGFEGIRIHAGNAPNHTEGCLLPGLSFSSNFVSNSRKAFKSLFEKIEKAANTQKVFITITE